MPAVSSDPPTAKSPASPLTPWVRQALARLPPDATIKGMFVNGLFELAEARGVSLVDGDVVTRGLVRRRPSFKDEPLADFMRIAVGVAQQVWPDRSLPEGLREVGHQTYRTFLQSLSGRVVFGVLGSDIEKLIGATTKAYALTQSHGRAVVVESSPTACVLEYRDLYQFLDCLEVGVVEEAVVSCGLRPVVTLELDTPVSGRMRIAFEPLAQP